MRKELDNSYLAEVSENGKFLGKSKLNVHGGDNNTVSNVLSTIDGGVTLYWNDETLASYDGTKSKGRIIPAGSIVVLGRVLIDGIYNNAYTFASLKFENEDYYIKCSLDGGRMYIGEPQEIVGVLAKDVNFGDNEVVNNVPVAICADVSVRNYWNALEKDEFFVNQNENIRLEMISKACDNYKTGHFSSFYKEAWFDNLNLNIK